MSSFFSSAPERSYQQHSSKATIAIPFCTMQSNGSYQPSTPLYGYYDDTAYPSSAVANEGWYDTTRLQGFSGPGMYQSAPAGGGYAQYQYSSFQPTAYPMNCHPSVLIPQPSSDDWGQPRQTSWVQGPAAPSVPQSWQDAGPSSSPSANTRETRYKTERPTLEGIPEDRQGAAWRYIDLLSGTNKVKDAGYVRGRSFPVSSETKEWMESVKSSLKEELDEFNRSEDIVVPEKVVETVRDRLKYEKRNSRSKRKGGAKSVSGTMKDRHNPPLGESRGGDRGKYIVFVRNDGLPACTSISGYVWSMSGLCAELSPKDVE